MTIGATNQLDPFQYSKFFVCRLNPKVPDVAFLGLSAVFHVIIVGRPTIRDKPWPMSIRSCRLLSILLWTDYITCKILYQAV